MWGLLWIVLNSSLLWLGSTMIHAEELVEEKVEVVEMVEESDLEPLLPEITTEQVDRIDERAKSSLSVEARLSSSTHIEWNRLEAGHPDYLRLSKALYGEKLLDSERSYLLPYGLLITVQANGPRTHLALHVDQIVSDGAVERSLPAKALLAYWDDGKKEEMGYQRMDQDLALLGEAVWALSPSERIQYKILFVLNTVEGDRSGEYKVRFRFLSTELP